METTFIEYKGINRSVSSQLVQDGWLDELINIRTRAGKRQPVGKPLKLYEVPTVQMPENTVWSDGSQWLNMWKHESDSINNYIGLHYFVSTDEFEAETAERWLRLIDMEAGTFTTIKDYTGKGNIKVEFLKNFMIVVYDGSGGESGGGMDRFIWKDGEYILLTLSVRPEFSLYKSDESYFNSTTKEIASGVVNEDLVSTLQGWYYDLLNSNSEDKYFTGGMFVRAAFKLFDGSYVLHTIPIFVAVNNFEIGIFWNKGAAPDMFNIGFTRSKLNIIIPSELYSGYEDENKLISDVVIFASKFESIINWDDSINDDILEHLEFVADMTPNGPATHYLNTTITGVNPAFKLLHDSASWYKIGEYPLSTILEGDINEELDLKSFYQDYATRETLPVDNFTHHELSAKVTYNYNSRLIIADTALKFGDYKQFPIQPILDGSEYPNIAPSGYTSFGTRYIRLLTTIETDLGTIKKLGQQFTRDIYNNPSYLGRIFIALAVGELGYPDARATKIEVLSSEDASNWFKVGSYNLTKSKYDNFAYYIVNNFTTAATAHVTGVANYPVIMHEFTGFTAVNLATYPVQTYSDQNRVQLSELNNPFYYPAKNSYQVGTGKVLALATNTEPLSIGQYGEYPLIVFTTKGTWSLLQGQGDVLFSNVKPLNGDVPVNTSQIVSVGTGVVYTTSRGMYLISGASVQELSQQLYGLPNLDLQSIANFLLRVNKTQLVQLVASLSTENANLFLSVANVGYNKYNNEIILSSPDYQYSYIYSLESQTWSKVNETYTTFVNAWPTLLGIRYNSATDGVYELTNEQFTNDGIDTLVVTRPCKIDKFANFNLIHRIIQRCELETPVSKYAGFYIFGSNDLKTWQLLQGTDKKTGIVTDLFCTRSHLKIKYFIFVFAATLKEGSAINHIELQYYSKLTNKIR